MSATIGACVALVVVLAIYVVPQVALGRLIAKLVRRKPGEKPE